MRRFWGFSFFLIVAAVVMSGQDAVQTTPKERRPVHPSSAPTTKSTIPSCTDQLPSLPSPNAPHGMFVLMFPGARFNSAAASKFLLHNPLVCGANFFVVWSRVDKGPGASPRYDWDYLDQQMAPWIAAGKTVNLIVWAVSRNAGGFATPDYVLSKVPTVECEHFGRVPVFWDRIFKDNYKTFISAVIGKYGTNSSVGYIRFGLGNGGETFPACKFALRPHGFSEEKWRNYLFEMLDYEKSLNSPKQLMVGINPVGNPYDASFPTSIAEHAVRSGIGFGTQGLDARDMEKHASGNPCGSGWCQSFERFQGRVPLELQTIAAGRADRSGPGSLADLIPFGLKLHAQIFEIYLEDWLVAVDPDSPDYAQYHDAYQRAFEAAAREVGGRP